MVKELNKLKSLWNKLTWINNGAKRYKLFRGQKVYNLIQINKIIKNPKINLIDKHVHGDMSTIQRSFVELKQGTLEWIESLNDENLRCTYEKNFLINEIDAIVNCYEEEQGYIVDSNKYKSLRDFLIVMRKKKDIAKIKRKIDVKHIIFDEFQAIYLIQLITGEFAIAGRLDIDFRIDIYKNKESFENGYDSIREFNL